MPSAAPTPTSPSSTPPKTRRASARAACRSAAVPATTSPAQTTQIIRQASLSIDKVANVSDDQPGSGLQLHHHGPQFRAIDVPRQPDDDRSPSDGSAVPSCHPWLRLDVQRRQHDRLPLLGRSATGRGSADRYQGPTRSGLQRRARPQRGHGDRDRRASCVGRLGPAGARRCRPPPPADPGTS